MREVGVEEETARERRSIEGEKVTRREKDEDPICQRSTSWQWSLVINAYLLQFTTSIRYMKPLTPYLLHHVTGIKD